jgi:hypothetical protein
MTSAPKDATSKSVTKKIQLTKKVALETLKQHIESGHLSVEQLKFIASVLGIDVPSANYFPSEEKYQKELVSLLLKHFETLDQNLWGATKSFVYWGGSNIFFTGLQSYVLYKIFTAKTTVNCEDTELKETCDIFGLKGNISEQDLTTKENSMRRSFARNMRNNSTYKSPDQYCQGRLGEDHKRCTDGQSRKINQEFDRRRDIIREATRDRLSNDPIVKLVSNWKLTVGFIIFVTSIGGMFSFYRLLFRAYQSAKNKWRASRIMSMIRKVMTATPSQYPKTLDPRQMCLLRTACSGECQSINGTCLPTDEAMFKYSLARHPDKKTRIKQAK